MTRTGRVALYVTAVALLVTSIDADARRRKRPTARKATPGLVAALARPIENAMTFRSCSAARAAGRFNIRRGEAGYGYHLDRDRDGIACESR